MSLHATRRWPQVDPGSEILLVPLGSTEQHGPHLPLDTDTRLAVAVASGAAARRTDTVVAPAVPYGASGEHQAFEGTLSIGTEVLAAVLIEIGRSALPPFRRVVIVNGHGGNRDAVDRALETLTNERRPVSAWWPDLDTGIDHRDTHAGHAETSMLLHLDPAAVDVASAAVGNTEPIDTLLPRLVADGVRPHSPNGVLGDPRRADADEGRVMFGHLVDSLVTHLAE